MKAFLQDLVAHTHSIGVIPLVKVTNTEAETIIDGIAEDKTVVMFAKTKSKVGGFEGVFGMPNLNKLDIILKCPEYKSDAIINVVSSTNKRGEEYLAGLHFQNTKGDFQNEYRFMDDEVINAKLKTNKFRAPKWDIEFAPSMSAIQRLKYQAAVHSEESQVTVSSAGNGTDLVFNFGDASTHAGNFVFQSDVEGTLKHKWSWPSAQLLNILNLPGDLVMRISDDGCMQLDVDSGTAVYNYIMPAMTK